MTKLQAERDRLSALAANSSLITEQLTDLRRLRAEAGPLLAQTNELAKLRAENRQLRSKTGQDNPKTPLQIKEEAVARMSYGKNWLVAFYQFADKNHGQFPTSFVQAAFFVPDKVKNQTDVTTNQFEIVYRGSPSALTKPQEVIVVREKEAWFHNGKWSRIYGFADGHLEIHGQADEDFDPYEKQHIVSPPANQ